MRTLMEEQGHLYDAQITQTKCLLLSQFQVIFLSFKPNSDLSVCLGVWRFEWTTDRTRCAACVTQTKGTNNLIVQKES